jgi:hypothetical protein
MKEIRVFISSVAEGYRKFRLAAKKAVEDLEYDEENLHIKVSMFERDAAKSSPSRKMLESKVKESDIYIGIFFDKESDATFDEFAWAAEKDIETLIFVDDSRPKDKKLELHLKSIRDYKSGSFTKEFTNGNIDQLKYEISRSTRNAIYKKIIKRKKLIKQRETLERLQEELTFNIDEIIKSIFSFKKKLMARNLRPLYRFLYAEIQKNLHLDGYQNLLSEVIKSNTCLDLIRYELDSCNIENMYETNFPDLKKLLERALKDVDEKIRKKDEEIKKV